MGLKGSLKHLSKKKDIFNVKKGFINGCLTDLYNEICALSMIANRVSKVD